MKMKYISMLLIIVIGGAASLSAMPPHPGLTEKFKKEGRISELNNRMLSMSIKQKTRAIMEKSYPSSGTARIPVILVRYVTPYQAASATGFMTFLQNENKKNREMIHLLLILLSVITASALIIRLRKPGLSVPLYICISALFMSCGVEPSDDSIDFPTDVSLYNRILNGDDTFTLSVKKYYSDMSNGNLNVQFDFFGPVIVSKEWEYYGENDSSGNDLHPGELVGEAVRLMVSKNMSTDFSIYDNNKDGAVDTVVVIHEGRGEESGAEDDTIWSHEYDLTSAKVNGDGYGSVYTDGIKFDKYTIVPEYVFTPGDSTIGVYCHELGHALGLPDIYDTSGATDGIGYWSLMGAGAWGGGGPAFDGSRPAPILTWGRYKLGGAAWVTITEVTSAGAVTVNDIETAPRTAYKVKLKDPGDEQYYLIEGKTASGADDWYVPGSGVLITHIHEGIINSYFNTNSINDGAGRVHGVTVVEADNDNSLWTAGGDMGSASDLYKSGNTLNDSSTPDTKYYTSELLTSKTGVSNVAISGFSAATVPMTVNITP